MSPRNRGMKRRTNLHARWGESSEFLLHAVGNTWEHGSTTGQDNVPVEITTDIEVTLINRVVRGFVDTMGFEAE